MSEFFEPVDQTAINFETAIHPLNAELQRQMLSEGTAITITEIPTLENYRSFREIENLMGALLLAERKIVSGGPKIFPEKIFNTYKKHAVKQSGSVANTARAKIEYNEENEGTILLTTLLPPKSKIYNTAAQNITEYTTRPIKDRSGIAAKTLSRRDVMSESVILDDRIIEVSGDHRLLFGYDNRRIRKTLRSGTLGCSPLGR